MSAACNRVLELEVGLAASQIERTYNFVDTDLFEARKTKLPDRPLRALVFSNYASELNYLPAVRAACEAEGIALDAVGLSVGAPTAHPERILGNYDLVFARGRAAIEAMAAGCAVILCDHEGMGVIVTVDNFEYLRHWNFGYHVLNNQHSTEFIRSQIREYDSGSATAVSHLIRSGSSLSGALDVLEEHYEQVLTDCAPPPGVTRILFDYSDMINDVSARMASDHDPSRVYDPLYRAYLLVYRAYLLGLYLLKAETERLAESTSKQPFLKRLISKWLSGP